MGMPGIPICRLCKGEKVRQSSARGYRYVCHCLEWKDQLKRLDEARKQERKRRR